MQCCKRRKYLTDSIVLQSNLRIRLKHLLGVLQRSLSQLGSAQHPGDLFGALVAGNLADARAGAVSCLFLFDQVMMISKCRDLRQMSHAKHLVRTGERLQFFPNCLSSAAADSGVNFVEYKCALCASGLFARTGFHARLKRQHHPPKFSPSTHLLQTMHPPPALSSKP